MKTAWSKIILRCVNKADKKSRPTISRLFFETKYFQFGRKTGPGQFQTYDLCRLMRIHCLQNKFAEDA